MQIKALTRYGAVPLAIFGGLAISLVAFFVLWRLQSEEREAAYERQAVTAISLVRSHIQTSLQVVRSTASLYNSSAHVTRAEFHTFVTPFVGDKAGIQALEWLPRVPAAERVTYEQRAREDGYHDFLIRDVEEHGALVPAPQREEYFPVFYVEPFAGNEAALGLDLGSEKTRRRALERARDTATMQASEPVTLVQDDSQQTGVLVFAPVFAKGQGPYRDEVDERQRELAGFALGVFRLRDLVHAALSDFGRGKKKQTPGIDLYLYDEHESDSRRLLVAYNTSDPHQPVQPIPEKEVRSPRHLAEGLVVAGRQWTLVAIPRAHGNTGLGAWIAGATLFVGLAFTAALGAYLLANEHRTRVLGELAELRTAELNAARKELHSRTSAREAAEATVAELQKLAKYLSPQVYASISAGKKPVEITSQRKKLTVLFCDIANFTQTVEELESEDVTVILNRYLSEMSEIGVQYQATIDKYVGDGIMMFFGDPESKGVKEDALICVTMAIAMQERMHDLQHYAEILGLRVPLQARVGISTGYCMVGNFGSEHMMNYTIVGAGVNLASRLQAAAAVGEILVSEDTYHLVKDEVRCEKHGAIELKGVAHPVVAYRVIGLREESAERSAVLRQDLPGMRFELDPRMMSEDERQRAVNALRQALRRLAPTEPNDDEKEEEG